MNLKLSNQTIELDTQKLTKKDKKKLIEALENDTWPKKGDVFYCIDKYATIWEYEWDENDNYQKAALTVGNVFRTEEEAEERLTYLKALQVLKGDTKGYEWKYGDQFHSVFIYEHKLQSEYGVGSYGEPVKFKTENDAKESIKLHEKEWRIVLLGEDK